MRYYNISLGDYESSVVPTLTGNDCVIQLGIQAVRMRARAEMAVLPPDDLTRACAFSLLAQIHADVEALGAAAVSACPSLRTASVLVRYGAALPDVPHTRGNVVVDLDVGEITDGVPAFAEFALKLVLNAITTGAHVRKGGNWRCRWSACGCGVEHKSC